MAEEVEGALPQSFESHADDVRRRVAAAVAAVAVPRRPQLEAVGVAARRRAQLAVARDRAVAAERLRRRLARRRLGALQQKNNDMVRRDLLKV